MYHLIQLHCKQTKVRIVKEAGLCACLIVGSLLGVTTLKVQAEAEPEAGLTTADNRRLYQETRELVRQWEKIKGFPLEKKGLLTGRVLRDLKLIDPTKLPADERILSLSQVLELLAKGWPDEYNRATIMTATLEGALWTVHLRDPGKYPPGTVLWDDTLLRLEIDGFSGTVLFPLE